MGVRSSFRRTVFLAALMSLMLGACGKQDAGSEASGSPGAGSTGSGPGNGTASSADTSGAGSVGATAAGAASSAGAAIEDSVITTKLKTAILADMTLKGSDISVETRNGEVLLTGSVSSDAQKDHAVKIARALNGVKNVNNKLTTKK